MSAPTATFAIQIFGVNLKQGFFTLKLLEFYGSQLTPVNQRLKNLQDVNLARAELTQKKIKAKKL